MIYYKLFSKEELKSLKRTINKKNRQIQYQGIIGVKSPEDVSTEIEMFNNLYKIIECNTKY